MYTPGWGRRAINQTRALVGSCSIALRSLMNRYGGHTVAYRHSHFWVRGVAFAPTSNSPNNPHDITNHPHKHPSKKYETQNFDHISTQNPACPPDPAWMGGWSALPLPLRRGSVRDRTQNLDSNSFDSLPPHKCPHPFYWLVEQY